MKDFKPLLAGKFDQTKITFPVLGSPKLDGIRCVNHAQKGPVSRKLLPIPNNELRKALKHLCQPWLDGELISGPANAPNAMNVTTTAVMGHDADWSQVKFYVFDKVDDKPYDERLSDLVHLHALASAEQHKLISFVPQTLIHNIDQLMTFEQVCVEGGYEGIMIRSPRGHYKFGRSTTNEGILLKVKRFEDMEGIVVDFVELMHNDNVAQTDHLGHTKRSSAKAGKVPGNTLGALVLKIQGFNEPTVEVGTGFSAELKQEIWNNRKKYLGAKVTFKYQPHGVKDKPRIPVFKGWRLDL